MNDQLATTTRHLRTRIPGHPAALAIIAGSGLGQLTDAVADPMVIPYHEIPHFPTPTVAGHGGNLVAGMIGASHVLVFCGRTHLYEGRPVTEIVYPVTVAAALGVPALLVTNAAGGINPAFQPGDLMMIEDHLNLTGANPLAGRQADPAVAGSSFFIDLTEAYAPALKENLLAAAAAEDCQLKRGVYLATRGPSYETPAEIRAFERLGADAVGMSTVLEVIEARYHGLEVAGLSCITNQAAGVAAQPLTHDEVLQVGQATAERLVRLVRAFVARLV